MIRNVLNYEGLYTFEQDGRIITGNWSEQIKFSDNLKSDILHLSNPYIFFAFDHYDFDIDEANFERMIEQAEVGFENIKFKNIE